MGLIPKKQRNLSGKCSLGSIPLRREHVCKTFSMKCTKNENLKHMFPLKAKSHTMKTRKNEKFKVFRGKTERYKRSAIIYMQGLLNSM